LRALYTLEPLADKKNIQLTTDISDEVPVLQADESKIQSMVANLVNNAIKFTHEQGRVSVLVSHQGGDLIICVSDTGMGIPKEDLPKIFDRFYRVHRPGKQIQGTGLGLAIVNEIVMMHAGRIEVESERDQGTTFTVVLPLTTRPISVAELVEQQ
jgi:two-component system phosphate regulon sensor histidine kinase PhoR